VVNQDDPQNIQVRLASYQTATYGQLTQGGQTLQIVDYSPSSQTMTLANTGGMTTPVWAEGSVVRYAGSRLTDAGLLQDGGSYTLHVVGIGTANSLIVQLLDPEGTVVVDSANDGIDPQSNAIVLNSTQSAIPSGTQVTYHAGGAGTAIGGLQDGMTYQTVIDPAHPTIVHLVATGASGGGTVLLTVNPALNANGVSYTITGIDAYQQTLTLSTTSGAPPLKSGDAVVFSGALGAGSLGLLDGATYLIQIPDPTNPLVVQLLASPAAGDSNRFASSLAASPQPESLQAYVDLESLDQSYLSGTSHNLTPTVNHSGISITATLTSTESLSVSSGIGSNPKLRSKSPRAFFSHNSGQTAPESLTGQVESKLAPVASLPSLTGSFLVNEVTNRVIAEVGSSASLASSGSVTVSSSVTEDSQAADNSVVTRPSDGKAKKASVAASVLINSLDNTSNAVIAGGGRVDATGDLAVTSTVTYPWAGQLHEVNKNADGSTALNGENAWSDILDFFDGTLGFQSFLVNNWADAAATASQDTIALAGSFNWITYTNNNQARIDSGALINQNPDFQSGLQGVSVTATTSVETVNFVGNTNWDFLPSDMISSYRNAETGGWGGVGVGALGPNQGKTAGVGVSLAFASLKNTTLALVGSGATFDSSADLMADASGALNTIDLGYSHGFSTGDRLVYKSNGGDDITGLQSGTVYYAI
ncbi:MAG: hypothetical protein NT069_10270, partial [Planctomycetota bacterium]|nr:hypothetical protein [Planctomycetota bacterium]